MTFRGPSNRYRHIATGDVGHRRLSDRPALATSGRSTTAGASETVRNMPDDKAFPCRSVSYACLSSVRSTMPERVGRGMLNQNESGGIFSNHLHEGDSR